VGIKYMRRQKGLFQNFVAKELGMSVRHYQRLENEGRKPTPEQAEKLAKLFGCEMSQICDNGKEAI
jgi:transcriptional regulator with XRE-family HTH domain